MLRLSPRLHRVLTRPVDPALLCSEPSAAPLGDQQLRITWLGTAGLALEHRGQVLLIDPFLTRPGLRQSLTRRLRPDPRTVRRFAPRAAAIVGSHSHHDHILDLPQVARHTGAPVVGSRSTCNYCRGWGIPEDRLLEVQAPHSLELGPFHVTLRPSLHGKAVAGRVPLPGSIPAGVRPPLRIKQFRNDDTFGVHVEVRPAGSPPLSIFHLGSADFLPQTVEGLECDVLLPCLVGIERRPGFVPELLAALRPRIVIPIHFDDFFAPLDRPLRQLPVANLMAFLGQVQASGHGCQTLVLDLLGSYRLGA
jgi:L-ascorbate metabolism protein UlaG (beta-lactamase superfamily)